MLKKIGEEALGNGMTVEWAWCDNVESPRDWEDNLGHILTWSRGCDSPDENPWADPVDFVADMLCEHFTFAELHGAVSAGRIGSLRFEAGEDGEERLLAWYKSMITGRAGWDDVEDYGDYRDKETLARAVAECAEAPSLLQEKIVLKTVYRMEHSGVAYSTSSFGDPWDSGAVGFAWATDEDALRWSGRAMDRAEAEGRLDEEVGRYSSWADGDTYGLELFDADGNAVEYVAGYIGEEDLEYGVAEMKALAAA